MCHLLLNYAFVDDENPYDKLNVRWSANDMKMIAEAASIHIPDLTSWQFALTERNIATDLTIGKVIDERISALLRVMLTDADIVPSSAHLSLSDPYWRQSSDATVEQSVRNILHSYLLDLLAAFPTSIDDDIADLKRSAQSTNDTTFTPTDLVLRFRLAKKRLLTQNIHSLQTSDV